MHTEIAQKTIFSFFGSPGSGKGTVAEKCVKDLGFKTLSTGNLCRKHISLETEFGQLIDGYIKAGQLVPDDLITDVVGDWLTANTSLGVSVILDGFPRTRGQAEAFLKYFKDFLPDYKFRVICFIISDEEVIKRLTNRFVCENKNCQAVYPPFAPSVKKEICELCGGKLVKRADDTIEVIKERLRRYPQYSEDLLNFYKSAGVVTESLNVEGKTIEQVFEDFKALLKK